MGYAYDFPPGSLTGLWCLEDLIHHPPLHTHTLSHNIPRLEFNADVPGMANAISGKVHHFRVISGLVHFGHPARAGVKLTTCNADGTRVKTSPKEETQCPR